MGANSAGIYGKDVAGTTEVYAVDEAGNASQQTPHYPPDLAEAAGIVVDPQDPFPEIHYTSNPFLGFEVFRYFKPDGTHQVVYRDLPTEGKMDWTEHQATLVSQRRDEQTAWDAADTVLRVAWQNAVREWANTPFWSRGDRPSKPSQSSERPATYTPKPKPAILARAE